MSTVTDELVVSPLSVSVKLVDEKTGLLTAYGQIFFQRLIQAINGALNILGQFNGVIGPAATIAGHPGTVAQITQHLNSIGNLLSLTNVVADVDLDHVASTATFVKTTPNQVSGAAAAYTALIASGPTLNKALVYDGSAFVPSDLPVTSVSGLVIPANTPGSFSKWLKSYSNTTGLFTETQPDFGDLTGSATAAQVPALSALTGAITSGQLPASGLSVTIVTAQLTTLGAQGSMTFTNGILTAQTPAT
jgi:hypothetical protein